jgi:hypothetical protein
VEPEEVTGTRVPSPTIMLGVEEVKEDEMEERVPASDAT